MTGIIIGCEWPTTPPPALSAIERLAAALGAQVVEARVMNFKDGRRQARVVVECKSQVDAWIIGLVGVSFGQVEQGTASPRLAGGRAAKAPAVSIILDPPEP